MSITVFEKRLNANLNKYKKMSLEQLIKYEDDINKKIYNILSIEEIIAAEFEILFEDLQDEIRNKQMDDEQLEIYNKFSDYIKKIRNRCENTELTDERIDNIKKIITILQLSLNIKPSFITSIIELDNIDLYNYLDNFLEKTKVKIKN